MSKYNFRKKIQETNRRLIQEYHKQNDNIDSNETNKKSKEVLERENSYIIKVQLLQLYGKK